MANKNNKRAVVSALFILLVIFSLFLFRNEYLPYAGNFLVAEDPLEKADAIFVFGGSIPNRIIEAVDIYKQGFAPLIIISKYPKPEGYKFLEEKGISYPEGHDINKSIALRLGIPESNIIITKYRAGSTLEELKLLKTYCLENNFKTIILVSTKSHTKRISLLFSDIAEGKIEGIVRYTRYDSYNPNKWWKDRNSLRQTMFEYQKLLHHLIVDRKNI
jgi:uncharacterized SAM-binding protein YcdF (DUF218 family)